MIVPSSEAWARGWNPEVAGLLCEKTEALVASHLGSRLGLGTASYGRLDALPSQMFEGTTSEELLGNLSPFGVLVWQAVTRLLFRLSGWGVVVPDEVAPHLIRGVVRHHLKLELGLHTVLPSTSEESHLPLEVRKPAIAFMESILEFVPFAAYTTSNRLRLFDTLCYQVALEVRTMNRRENQENGFINPTASAESNGQPSPIGDSEMRWLLAHNPRELSKDGEVTIPQGSSEEGVAKAVLQLVFTGVCELSLVLDHMGGMRTLLPAINTIACNVAYDKLCQPYGKTILDSIKRERCKKLWRVNKMIVAELHRHGCDAGRINAVARYMCKQVFEILTDCFERGTLGLFPLMAKGHWSTTLLYFREVKRAIKINLHYPVQLKHQQWTSERESGSPFLELSGGMIIRSSAGLLAPNEPMNLDEKEIMRSFLNYMGSIPFSLNKYAIQVQEEGLRSGYRIDRVTQGFVPWKTTPSEDGRKHSSYWKSQIRQEKCNRDWYRYVLRELRHLTGVDEFYIPHHLDFRGRVYPMSTVFSIASIREVRSVLRFARPIPLGPDGLRWLKIHAANMYGMTKRNFDDRVQFIDSHIDAVVSVAEKPYGTQMEFWAVAENAFEFIVACKEIADALRYPNPEEFPSSLPVQVDGTANGLQHYSAISRDPLGARAVNLVPAAEPQDLYNTVLDEMHKQIFSRVSHERLAGLLVYMEDGRQRCHIRRSTIKRAVMTQVYGVTEYGMRRMLRETLIEQNMKIQAWTEQQVGSLAPYLVTILKRSLGTVFSECIRARAWLKSTAELAYYIQPAHERRPLSFHTPLQFHVVPPYRERKHTVLFDYQRGPVRVHTKKNQPSKKHISSFCANFIHSLDATHLALTALRMRNEGLPMASVHDSYWCHAANMSSLSRILREEFYNLYSEMNPLEILRQEWNTQYADDLSRHGLTCFPPPPPCGSSNLREVLNSEYFFS